VRKARQALSRPGSEPRPKGRPSPEPKSPVTPKDHATPKGPAKPDPAATKPKDADAGPGKDRTPDREPSKDRTPEKDRTPDKDRAPAKDKASETAPKKKQKEIEGPKPAKPKKPKSPVGKALSRAKGAVKSALKKVGNAAKTLGRKLKKSKLGKALKNGASKLRNFLKRKKDQLRDHKRRQQEQKRQKQDQRKKDEKSKESKEARLARIVPRVRKILSPVLHKGINPLTLRSTLAALRTWYRLTALERRGVQRGNIWATLNPEKPTNEFVEEDPEKQQKKLEEASAPGGNQSDQEKERQKQDQKKSEEEAGRASAAELALRSAPGDVTLAGRRPVEEKDGRLVPASGKVLLVGEGNLSFTEANLNLNRNIPSNVTATIYEKEEDIKDESTLRRAEELRNRGVNVEYDVDATRLHARTPRLLYDNIIWMFPHPGGDRQGVATRGQALLSAFLPSAREVLAPGGRISVTLKSNWYVSRWRPREIGAAAGLRLVAERPFRQNDYSGYYHETTAAGARPADISTGITFIFMKAEGRSAR
jgi:hypothetical protein